MADENMNESDRKFWSDVDTKLLISIRLLMEEDFTAGRKKKAVLWGKVLMEMKSISSMIPFNKEAIKRKFENLKITYTRIKKGTRKVEETHVRGNILHYLTKCTDVVIVSNFQISWLQKYLDKVMKVRTKRMKFRKRSPKEVTQNCQTMT